jgi:hypothetical protein
MADPGATPPVESPASFGKGPQGQAKRWKAEVDLFESQQQTFWERCDRIKKRYRNDTWRDAVDTGGLSNDTEAGRGFSLLWANQQTLQPVIYAQEPKANVQRRYKDKDPVARVAGMALERCLDYFIDRPDFEETTRQCRDDYLLVGQGVQWRRYVPHMANLPKRVGLKPTDAFVDDQGVQITNDASGYKGGYETEDGSELSKDDQVQIDEQGPYIERTEQAIKHEEVCREHVNQRDFGWSPGARTWAEASAVWRKVYMDRDALIDRFGKEKGEKVNLDFNPAKNSDKADKEMFKKATIYEIWDKATKKAHWLAKAYDGDLLDTRDDPLGIDGFFPCARPLFATQTTDQITPVPEYLQYQDQAEEMDRLTQKAYIIMDAIKVRGLYAGNIPEMQRLLQDSTNLDFQPVAESIATMSGGDLSKMVWIWPLKDLVEALAAILEARERVKMDSYEITGISDIIRGATDPNETATAQQLKSQTGAVRVQDRQREMQRWIRDGLRIDADIIMNHFQPETIADIADLSSIPEADYIQIDGEWKDPATGKAAGQLPGENPMMGHNGGPPMPAQGMPSGAPGVPQAPMGAQPMPGGPPPMMQGVPQGIPIPPPAPQGPTLGEAAIMLLKDKTQRKFRIDIETDSTVQLDQAQEKQDRAELVEALTGFLGAIAPIVEAKPVTIPMFTEIMLFAVRGFKAGASLEGMIESTMEALGNQPPPQPQPDPKLLQIQAQAKLDEAQSQREDARLQQEMQIEQGKAGMEAQARQQEVAADAQKSQQEMQLAAFLGELDMRLKQMDLLMKREEMQMDREIAQDHIAQEQQMGALKVDQAKEMGAIKAEQAAKPKPTNGAAK